MICCQEFVQVYGRVVVHFDIRSNILDPLTAVIPERLFPGIDPEQDQLFQ